MKVVVIVLFFSLKISYISRLTGVVTVCSLNQECVCG